MKQIRDFGEKHQKAIYIVYRRLYRCTIVSLVENETTIYI